MIFGSYDDLLNLGRALGKFFNHGQWNNGGVIKIHVQITGLIFNILQHANNGQWLISDVNNVSDGSFGAEQIDRQLLTDDNSADVVNKLPSSNLQISDVF